MASTVAGGLFNAVAFAGAGFLFSKLNHGGYEEEIRRHNKALESLAKAKEAWYERTVERNNREAKLRREIADANDDIVSTNHALDDLHKVYMEMHEDEEPVLGDYYTPSQEMEDYQHVATGVIGIGAGGLAGYVLKKLIL